MNNNYMKIVKMIIPDRVVVQISEQSKVNLMKTQSICVEIIARVFGDGKNIDKKIISHRLKNIISKNELRLLLKRLNDKYSINSNEVSAVLSLLIPIMFKRLNSIDLNNMTDTRTMRPVYNNSVNQNYQIPNYNNNIRPSSQSINYDSVFKNIENQASHDETLNFNKSELTNANRNYVKYKNKPYASSNPNNDIVNKICIYTILIIFALFVCISIVLIIKQLI